MDAALQKVIAELAPTGRLRAAINLGNQVLARKNPINGELTGASVALACELGRRLGLEVTLLQFATAGQVVEAIASEAWDVAFLAIDPARAAEICFTAPYALIEGSYIVRDDSPFRAVADLDRPDTRIAAGRGTAYDLYLSRTLKHATLVRSVTSSGAIDLFLAAGLQAAAGVRQTLVERADRQVGLRVIDGRFMVIEQALGTPQGRPHAGEYLRSFVELMKEGGFVTATLECAGQHAVSQASLKPY